jgi:hypothetical protein
VDVGDIADISEAHAVSIFRVDMSWLGECLFIYTLLIHQSHGREGGALFIFGASCDRGQRRVFR